MAMGFNDILEKIEGLPDVQKYGGLAGLIAICGALFWWLVYSPNLKLIEEKQNKISSLTSEIQKGDAMKARERQLEAEINRLDDQLKIALEFLPLQKEMNTFIKTIENLAVDSGLMVDSFEPKPDITEGFKSELPVDLRVRGDFQAVGLFLEKLGFERRIVTVNALRINGVQQPGFTLNAFIRVQAFYFKSES